MLKVENARVWNINPLVASVDDFLSEGECDAIIGLARDRLRRATVVTNDSYAEVSEERTNSDCVIEPGKAPVLAGLCLRLGVVLRLPFPHAEGVSVLHYAPGQEFRPHPDGFDMEGAPEYVARAEATGGQRLFTTICYLNDVEEGGATAFTELKFSVSPKRGRLLIFSNTLAGSRGNTSLSLHAGTPVVRGEKWAATVWWRERPWKQLDA